MAWVSTTELPRQTAQETMRGREYRRVFHVLYDSVSNTAFQAAHASGIPKVLDEHPDDSTAVCETPHADRNAEQPMLWTVECNYATPSGRSDTYSQIDPMDRDAEVSWEFWEIEEPAEKDKDGVAILNSAGQPFDPPVMRTVQFPVFVVTRNEISLNAITLQLYSNVVNSSQFAIGSLVAAPGQAKLKVRNAQYIREAQYSYWRITYEIAFCFTTPEGWQAKVLDQGTMSKQWDGTSMKLADIKDFMGTPVSAPVLLDGNGFHNVLWSQTATWLPCNRYRTASFEFLNLLPFGAGKHKMI